VSLASDHAAAPAMKKVASIGIAGTIRCHAIRADSVAYVKRQICVDRRSRQSCCENGEKRRNDSLAERRANALVYG
jgi:hypothetical protein